MSVTMQRMSSTTSERKIIVRRLKSTGRWRVTWIDQDTNQLIARVKPTHTEALAIAVTESNRRQRRQRYRTDFIMAA